MGKTIYQLGKVVMEKYAWQLSNLKLSKKLQELGILQDSLWWWVKYLENGTRINPKGLYKWKLVSNEDVYYYKTEDWSEVYSAFTVAELGKMLPESAWSIGGGTLSGLEINKADGKWLLHYNEELIEADTLANAMAKMVIYLNEEKKQKEE